jgi:tetrapyrrole methylase family protein/MazG family protein
MTQKTTSQTSQTHPEFDGFVDTIATLRAPNGCPWDRAQTHDSIAHNMIEEAYEAVAAIEALKDADPGTPEAERAAQHLCEELGDVLLQVVLQAQIAADAGEFDIDDVARAIDDKMIRRHPHIFGDADASTPEQVEALWSQAKQAEREKDADRAGEAGLDRKSLLDDVPESLPALMQAQKISKKAVAQGFEWGSVDDVWGQVRSEVVEFREAATEADREMEFGDVLFSLVNVARWEGLDAESALRAACGKFRRRWAFMEGAAWAQGRELTDFDMAGLQNLWDQAKAHEYETGSASRAATEDTTVQATASQAATEGTTAEGAM